MRLVVPPESRTQTSSSGLNRVRPLRRDARRRRRTRGPARDDRPPRPRVAGCGDWAGFGSHEQAAGRLRCRARRERGDRGDRHREGGLAERQIDAPDASGSDGWEASAGAQGGTGSSRGDGGPVQVLQQRPRDRARRGQVMESSERRGCCAAERMNIQPPPVIRARARSSRSRVVSSAEDDAMPGRNLLFVPGPTNTPDRILRAMHVADGGSPLLDLSRADRADLSATSRRSSRPRPGSRSSFPAPAPAAGKRRWCNTLSPGDKVLSFRYGQFSHLWIDMMQRLGLDVTAVDVEWGEGAPPETIQRDR